MKTLGEILKLSSDFLHKKGIDRPRREVEELLSWVLHLPRIELYMQFDRPLIEQELTQLREAVKRRAEGEPWQYIAGEVEFFSCRIKVNKDVLIPRQETEILVDRIVKELPASPVEIWDVCTGSGCIGIALKKKRVDCKVILSDISKEALSVAKENAEKNGVEVEFLQGDLLQPFQGKADIIVCNPPYISEKEYANLDREVRQWEPKTALVGGIQFYERLSHDLPRYLNPNGKVYFEMGTGMGQQIKNLFLVAPWKTVQIIQDWSSHDRFLLLETE
ncbi:MAG TPA: peptide chain release factor N(5)-glutamine methyltransferase [Rhabdochlamydiaceae bacterium]|jgi:release factor glutamine methyltransferase|nr:peptide chain release factor N(5)-glutamine methyltransferase [Rhabdochlamydiaceae bacterium]